MGRLLVVVVINNLVLSLVLILSVVLSLMSNGGVQCKDIMMEIVGIGVIND